MAINRSAILAAGIGAILMVALLALFNHQSEPSAPEQAKRDSTPPPLKRLTLSVAGPDGKRITARLFAPVGLTHASGDLCGFMKARLAALPQLAPPPPTPASQAPGAEDDEEPAQTEQERRTELQSQVTQICEAAAPAPAFFEAGSRARAAYWARGGERQASEALQAELVIWAIDVLPKTVTADDTLAVIDTISTGWLGQVDGSMLAQNLLFADLSVLRASFCKADDPGVLSCRAGYLLDGARDYADTARLTGTADYYVAAEQAVDKALAEASQIKDDLGRWDFWKRAAQVLGYAGEAGRNRALLERAVDLSRKYAEQSKAAMKDGSSRFNRYFDAIDILATSLGRLAIGDPDPRPRMLEAIELGKESIAEDEKNGGTAAWTTLINVASSWREIAKGSNTVSDLTEAEGYARRALHVISGKRSADETGPDANVQYVNMVLGQTLADRVAADGIPQEKRAALIAEARKHLGQAKALFEKTRAKTYLGYIAKAQRILDDAAAAARTTP